MNLSMSEQTLKMPNTLHEVKDMKSADHKTTEKHLSADEMERIVAQYGDKMLRMCFLYLKDRGLAEDAVQETFIKIYKNYSSFCGLSSERTWVMRVAINVCKNLRRSAWFHRVSCEEMLESIPSEVLPDDGGEKDALLTEIMRLKPKYKEVILLYYYQNLKTAEIARVLSVPESTVSVRLMRAKEQLKTNLKGWYYNE